VIGAVHESFLRISWGHFLRLEVSLAHFFEVLGSSISIMDSGGAVAFFTFLSTQLNNIALFNFIWFTL